MSRKLFGTDGIRGEAGKYPLDRRTVFAIGMALGHHVGAEGKRPRVVIGQDTRQSSGWIADTVAAGLEAAGVEVASAGVLPTPGVAYLARMRGFDAGVVVSASHNPWQDNGIKVFGGNGYKLADAIELEIEQELFELLEKKDFDHEAQPSSPTLPGDAKLRREYEEWLRASVGAADLGGIRVVVDCANGAASTVAPELFRLAGVLAEFIHVVPDGKNINANCGALHPEVVAAEVKMRAADLGICFDGDADRALFANARGEVVNGDAVLLLAGRDLQERGALHADTIVATTMSNMGLEAALKRAGIKMLRAPVGDKYVLEEMQRTGATLGGEQSGHIIFLHIATTGDGLLTALEVLSVLARARKPLHELVADLEVYPQIIKNVRVREKKPLDQVPAVAQAIAQVESELNGDGRVVVRYSGTESLCRVMVEAKSEEKMRRLAETIAGALEKELGA